MNIHNLGCHKIASRLLSYSMASKSSKAFRLWKARMGLSYSKAAKALDLSQASISYYCSGKRRKNNEVKDFDIPKIVLLACAALEREIPPIN